jgi:hypothetical protein
VRVVAAGPCCRQSWSTDGRSTGAAVVGTAVAAVAVSLQHRETQAADVGMTIQSDVGPLFRRRSDRLPIDDVVVAEAPADIASSTIIQNRTVVASPAQGPAQARPVAGSLHNCVPDAERLIGGAGRDLRMDGAVSGVATTLMVSRMRPMCLLVAVQLLSGCVVAAGSPRGDSGAGFLVLAVPFVMVVLVAMLVRRVIGGGGRRARRSEASGASGVVNPHVLRAELSVLADDVIRLEPLVAIKEAARDDFEAATHRYRVAHVALDQVTEPADLLRVQRVVDEANWSMSRARATVEGRPPPSPPRSLRRPGPSGEPAIGVDDREQPIYVGSPASFRSGWFAAGGGGLLGGLFLGGYGSMWTEQATEDGRWDETPDREDW